MRKSRLFMLLVAGALVLGIAGGAIIATTTASAQENSNGSGKGFAARVAEKLTSALGLSQDEAITEFQVQAAFHGAAGDQQDERLQARLDELEVEAETATAIMDWFRAYPYSDLIRLRYIGLASAGQVSDGLEHLVERERITQAQSDGIQSWFDDRPELPEGLGKVRHGGRSGFHEGRGEHRGRHSDRDNGDNGDNDGRGEHRGRHSDGDNGDNGDKDGRGEHRGRHSDGDNDDNDGRGEHRGRHSDGDNDDNDGRGEHRGRHSDGDNDDSNSDDDSDDNDDSSDQSSDDDDGAGQGSST